MKLFEAQPFYVQVGRGVGEGESGEPQTNSTKKKTKQVNYEITIFEDVIARDMARSSTRHWIVRDWYHTNRIAVERVTIPMNNANLGG